jgi:hypothetical protein
MFDGGVQHAVVLNAGARTDVDRGIIGADDRPRPHRRLLTEHDGADQDGVRMHVRRGVDVGDEVAEGIDGHPARVPNLTP